MTANDVLEGWCTACGQELLLDKISGDCWHPYTVTAPCPPTQFVIGVEVFYSNRPDRKYWVATRELALTPPPVAPSICSHSPTTYSCVPRHFHDDVFCHAHPSHDWPCPHLDAAVTA